MIHTPICDMLGIEYPIFQGGMAWIADGKLAAAVSNGGGLGIISAMNATFSARALSSSTEISSVREKGRWTDQTFNPEALMSARAFSARS